MPQPRRSGYYGFKVIGALKLVSGLIAVVAGIGAVRFLAHDPGAKLERVVTHLGLDPQNNLIHTAIAAARTLGRLPRNVSTIIPPQVERRTACHHAFAR